tara:strand:+ start:79 stop:354 length:276 start_codon:yes stop_codon:yes gene_type:complete
MVAMVLATAKLNPMPAAVRIKILGSIMGDAIQKAITGASGKPARSIAAMSGITPQEQNGETAPTNAARIGAFTGLPVKALAMSELALVAEA